MTDKYIDAIQLIKSSCSTFKMSNLVNAADAAFGEGASENNKCMKQFAPFFTNLFNPENHRYEEVRTASQFGFGGFVNSIKSVSHKTIGHVTKASHVAINHANQASHIAIDHAKQYEHIAVTQATKFGHVAINEVIDKVTHAPYYYSKLNAATGGLLDVAVVVAFTGLGTMVGGPLGGMIGGGLGSAAV